MSGKIIIGLVGQLGSGKDALADYLVEKYGASKHRFSTAIADCLNRLGLPTTRENFQVFSDITREHFGQNLYARTIANDCQGDPAEIVIANGVRRHPDIAGLTKVDGFHLVYVTVPIEIRYERITKRGEKDGEANITFEQFEKQCDSPVEASIEEVGQQAEFTIDNSGTLEDLYHQADELIAKLRQE